LKEAEKTIPVESTHRGAITIQLYSYIAGATMNDDIGGERRIMTTENSATTVTTRMKWNLILKQAFDHRYMLAAIVAVECNSGCGCGCGCGERAWHFRQSSASGKVDVVVFASVATPRQQRHTL